jgi:hypothetical protein
VGGGPGGGVSSSPVKSSSQSGVGAKACGCRCHVTEETARAVCNQEALCLCGYLHPNPETRNTFRPSELNTGTVAGVDTEEISSQETLDAAMREMQDTVRDLIAALGCGV